MCQDKNAHLKFEFQTPNCWSELLKNHINTSTCRNYLGNKWENSRSQKINCLSSALYTHTHTQRKPTKFTLLLLIVYYFSLVKTLTFSTALTGKIWMHFPNKHSKALVCRGNHAWKKHTYLHTQLGEVVFSTQALLISWVCESGESSSSEDYPCYEIFPSFCRMKTSLCVFLSPFTRGMQVSKIAQEPVLRYLAWPYLTCMFPHPTHSWHQSIWNIDNSLPYRCKQSTRAPEIILHQHPHPPTAQRVSHPTEAMGSPCLKGWHSYSVDKLFTATLLFPTLHFWHCIVFHTMLAANLTRVSECVCVKA